MPAIRPIAALTAVVLLALPSAGGAQVSSADAPVMYGADQGEVTPTGISLRGRAEILQGQNRLRADAIVGARSPAGELTSIEATGGVYFVTPTQTMRGDKAVYDLTRAEVVVTGDVILTQGQNVLTGGRLVYNVRTEEARMEGGGRSAGGRIQGVFYPEKRGG